MSISEMTEDQKKSIYSQAYHSRYEDNLPWKFVTGIVNMNLGTNYTVKQVQKVCDKIASQK
jgi:lysozyme family protein